MAKPLRVHDMDEGGYVVYGTLDVNQARAAVEAYIADGYELAPEWTRPTVPSRTIAGLFRWNPCSPNSCYGLGGHKGHLEPVEKRGPGVWPGVEFVP